MLKKVWKDFRRWNDKNQLLTLENKKRANLIGKTIPLELALDELTVRSLGMDLLYFGVIINVFI